ncbi:MAG: heavy-metal-associated domain-containing protein, partial [Actinomycetota bacterium]|nr:heavy-metal-associated domain-containing protein [Actinomycetota bacterium]
RRDPRNDPAPTPNDAAPDAAVVGAAAAADTEAEARPEEDLPVHFDVPDISCGHCRSTIEKALGALDGVTAVEVDVDHRTVDVAGTASPDVVRAALVDAGYEPAA